MHGVMSPRRIRWTMRAFVYVPLALLAVVVLGMRDPDVELGMLEGKTSQGEPVLVQFEDDAVAIVRMPVRLDCTWGRAYVLTWTARDGVFGEFHREGDRLTIHDAWTDPEADGEVGRGVVELDAEIDGERRASGRVRAEVRWSRGGSCGIRDVTWTASE